MRKPVSLAAVLLAVNFFICPAIASADLLPQPGYVGIDFTDFNYETTSYLIIDEGQSREKSISPLCNSISDKKCEGKPLRFNGVMPVCSSDSETNCIVTVEAINSMGERFAAHTTGYFPSGTNTAFRGDQKLHIPNGAASSVWSIPEAAHCGGTNYGLNFSADGAYRIGYSKADINNFQIRLSPIQIVTGDKDQIENASGLSQSCKEVNSGRWACENDGWSNRNAWNTSLTPEWDNFHEISGTCAVKFRFPEGFRFRVVVRTNLLPNGWLHGRIGDPRVQIVTNANSTLIDVEATPIVVSSVLASTPWNDLSAVEKSTFDSQGRYTCPNGEHLGERGLLGIDPETRGPLIQASSSGDCSMLLLRNWVPRIVDRATQSNTVWSLRNLNNSDQKATLDLGPNYEINSCFNDASSVAGLVTTNSTTYLAGPPVFNKTDGVLTYKVASPHLQPDGSIFKGTYNLALRSDVARCIYKFSAAPISASIEVVSENGTQQVAITSMSEKDGWIYLSASGFTYSSPTVKVKLEQAKVEAPAVPASIAVTPVAAPQTPPTKRSITCINGKNVKKVTAVNPKCPVGYKKK